MTDYQKNNAPRSIFNNTFNKRCPYLFASLVLTSILSGCGGAGGGIVTTAATTPPVGINAKPEASKADAPAVEKKVSKPTIGRIKRRAVPYRPTSNLVIERALAAN